MRAKSLIFLLLIIFPYLLLNTARGKSFFNRNSTKNKTPVILSKKGFDTLLHPKIGDVVYYQLILKNYCDTIIFDTHKEFGVQQLTLEKPGFRNDLNAQIQLLFKGDSALILISCDSLYGQYMPQFAKHKKFMKFYLTLIDFMSKEAYEKKNKEEYDAQAIEDSVLITNYLKNKNRKAQKGENGLFYAISKNLDSSQVQIGDTVWVNYTGRLLDGTIFDSNTDARFGHAEPFHFVVGKGNVIKGWDQGLLQFSAGEEGHLYIPSGLAYGKRSSGPIPSNSVLIFDISIVKCRGPINTKK